MSNKFPIWYDRFMGPLEKRRFKAFRRELLQKARGNVIELGSGTGVNFPYYKNVERVTAIEPNQYMINRSKAKIQEAAVPIEIIRASAERLPFGDDSFDTVVATLVLCTIPNPEKAIKEIKRVCKPGGSILVFEHIRMDHPFLAKMQDRLTPFWKRICDGCHLNRRTPNLINIQGLKVIHTQRFYKGLFVLMELTKEGVETFKDKQNG